MTVASYLTILQVTHTLYQKLLQGELDSIYNEIEASYRVIQAAGIADVESYVTAAQQKLLEKAKYYSFGNSGFVFVLDKDAQVLLHPSYPAGQKLEFEFIQQILARKIGKLTFEYQHQIYVAAFTYFPQWKWYVVLAIKRDEIFEEHAIYLWMLPVFSGITFLITLLLALLMIRLNFKWLPAVIATLQRIKNGKWEVSMAVTRNDEIGIIQRTINMIMQNLRALSMELEQYQKVLDNTIYGVCIFDAQNYNILYVNQNICRRLGYSESELLQMKPACITTELEPENITPRLRQLLAEEQSEFIVETISYHKKGAPIPIKMTIYLFSPTREQQRVICVMRDISQQKQIEKTLQRNEERLRLALEVTHDGLWEINFATGETYFNPTYYTMLGYKPQEFPANYQSWLNLLHPDDRTVAEQSIKNHIDNPHSLGFELEFRLKTKTGGWKWILARGKIVERTAAGIAQRAVGTHVDLTLHKQAQETLRVTEERFNFAIKDLHDGWWDWNIQSNEIYFSPRWKQMLGYEEAELSSHPEEFFNRLHSDDLGNVMNRISNYLERRIATYEVTVRVRHQRGHYIWVLVRGSAQWDSQGKPLRLAGTHTDISSCIHKWSESMR